MSEWNDGTGPRGYTLQSPLFQPWVHATAGQWTDPSTGAAGLVLADAGTPVVSVPQSTGQIEVDLSMLPKTNIGASELQDIFDSVAYPAVGVLRGNLNDPRGFLGEQEVAYQVTGIVRTTRIRSSDGETNGAYAFQRMRVRAPNQKERLHMERSNHAVAAILEPTSNEILAAEVVKAIRALNLDPDMWRDGLSRMPAKIRKAQRYKQNAAVQFNRAMATAGCILVKILLQMGLIAVVQRGDDVVPVGVVSAQDTQATFDSAGVFVDVNGERFAPADDTSGLEANTVAANLLDLLDPDALASAAVAGTSVGVGASVLRTLFYGALTADGRDPQFEIGKSDDGTDELEGLLDQSTGMANDGSALGRFLLRQHRAFPAFISAMKDMLGADGTFGIMLNNVANGQRGQMLLYPGNGQ